MAEDLCTEASSYRVLNHCVNLNGRISLPLHLHSTLPSRHEIIHQVVYRFSPIMQQHENEQKQSSQPSSRYIRLEVILNRLSKSPASSEEVEARETSTANNAENNVSILKEDGFPSAEKFEIQGTTKEDIISPHEQYRSLDVEASVICKKSEDFEVELLLPDR